MWRSHLRRGTKKVFQKCFVAKLMYFMFPISTRQLVLEYCAFLGWGIIPAHFSVFVSAGKVADWGIIGKSINNSTDRKITRRNSTEAIIRNLPQKYVGKSSILYVNFHSKLQKNSTCMCSGHKSTVHWQTYSTASLINSTDVSARFSNYGLRECIWYLSSFLHIHKYTWKCVNLRQNCV